MLLLPACDSPDLYEETIDGFTYYGVKTDGKYKGYAALAQEQKWSEALAALHRLNDEDNALTQHLMAAAYEGLGNKALSFTYHLKSASQGYVPSQLMVAVMYRNGLGVRQNPEEAFKWFKKVAERNERSAEKLTSARLLSHLYDTGDGVEKNSELANYWYEIGNQW